MIRFIAVIVFLLPSLLSAELANPVKWSFSLSSQTIHVGDTVEVIAQGVIEENWYLYSNDFDPNLGPTITEFEFTPHAGYRLLGKPKAVKPKTKYDAVWGGDITYFTEHAEFRQKIIILNESPSIAFMINYQSCNDLIGRCVPGEAEHTFSGLTILPAKKVTSKGTTEPVKGIQQPVVTPGATKSIQQLEADKQKLIQRDKNGNDISLNYLKTFVKKYGK